MNANIDIALSAEEFESRFGRKKTVGMFTLGCKVNQYETNAMEDIFERNGYDIVDPEEFADIYVINSCTVTHISDRKSRQFLRRAKRTNPDSIIAVTGCYSQVAPDEVAKIEEVDVIVGTKDKSKIVQIIEGCTPGEKTVKVENVMKLKTFEEMHIEHMRGKTRAFIKIQDGCNRFCSYCIIPYARGGIRSRGIDNIVSEVKELARAGFKEIVLTGINVACYGDDLDGDRIIDVIRAVHEIDGIERIRMSSVEPDMMSREFVSQIASLHKVCPHFHLSIQSGCDETLKRMNRKYTASDVMEVANTLREYFDDVALTTDIIVGFPGETDKEFEKTYEFLREIELFQMHIFKFSPRKGTPAAKMKDQIDPQTKSSRSEKLIALSQKNTDKFMENLLGREVDVLFEKEIKPGIYEGHTSNYVKVVAMSGENIEGLIKKVKLDEISEGKIEGILK